MKKRFKIPPSLVEKYKDDICFMIEIDFTCMDVVEPRVKFVDPMGYEMSENLKGPYVKIILESDRDKEYPRWGTYEEKMKELYSELYSKENKKKVENEDRSYLERI